MSRSVSASPTVRAQLEKLQSVASKFAGQKLETPTHTRTRSSSNTNYLSAATHEDTRIMSDERTKLFQEDLARDEFRAVLLGTNVPVESQALTGHVDGVLEMLRAKYGEAAFQHEFQPIVLALREIHDRIGLLFFLFAAIVIEPESVYRYFLPECTLGSESATHYTSEAQAFETTCSQVLFPLMGEFWDNSAPVFTVSGVIRDPEAFEKGAPDGEIRDPIAHIVSETIAHYMAHCRK
jgi:hypothetical protein